MIRFRHLFGIARELDRQHVEEMRAIYVKAFPYLPGYVDKLIGWLEHGAPAGVEPVLLLSLSAHKVTGFAWVLYFPDRRLGYLDYLASDPGSSARGIGGALYEALRELMQQKGARGLFLEVPHDDPKLLREPERAPLNRKRLRFYEQYGAFPVEHTAFDCTATAANEGWMTHLVFDPLDRSRPLRAAAARRFVRALYRRKYDLDPKDPVLAGVIASFIDDPVRLRSPRYVQPEVAMRAVPKRLARIKVVTTERHWLHHMKEKGYVERPVRMEAVLKGLEGIGMEKVAARHYGESPIRAVHTAALVGYLARASARLDPKQLIYPTVFPLRRRQKPPRSFEMRAGYFCLDTFTPLGHNTYRAARSAVDAALTGARLVLDGERFAYALCRPPGHHAEPGAWGGFCYFNNAAIAAHFLSAHGKVALIDIDHHHGNGTQEIFYRRSDVLVINLHCSPDHAYPYFSGFADERGEGEGKGFNLNYPLPPGTGDDAYMRALGDAVHHIKRFAPEFLVVSLGYDIMRGDPTGTFTISGGGMRSIGRRLGGVNLPTLLVQEGGYSLRNLRIGSRALAAGLTERW